MHELGFDIGHVSPCHFYHRNTETCGMVTRGMVHGDDHVFAGTEQFLKDIAKDMEGISAAR